MHIKLFYNENPDEFSRDLSLESRLKRYIEAKFYPAYIIAALSPIYLLGGAIRDLIYARHPKDLDFAVLNQDNLDWILEVFKKFDIDFHHNKFGGFKFTFNDIEIDLWLTNDLFQSVEYNIDGLYFDLANNRLISLTFDDFKNNGIKLINPENNIKNGRELKLHNFERKYLKDNKLK